MYKVLDRASRYLPIVGILVGLTGISLALYFHLQSIRERVPTYYVHPARAKIVDATGPAPAQLQILYRGRLIGSKSVIAARLYVWNEGRLPIKKEDILEPLVFVLQPPSKILEARILKQSRGVVKFALRPTEGTSRNLVPISFDILEQSDGAAIQVIYTGDPAATISLRGTIVEVAAPRFLEAAGAEQLSRRPTPRETFRFRTRTAILTTTVGLGALVSTIMYWLLHKFLRKGKAPTRVFAINVTLGILATCIYLFSGLYFVYDAYSTRTPGVPTTIWLEE